MRDIKLVGNEHRTSAATEYSGKSSSLVYHSNGDGQRISADSQSDANPYVTLLQPPAVRAIDNRNAEISRLIIPKKFRWDADSDSARGKNHGSAHRRPAGSCQNRFTQKNRRKKRL